MLSESMVVRLLNSSCSKRDLNGHAKDNGVLPGG
jgi:hypothetical protein